MVSRKGTQYYGYDSGNKRVWKRFLYNGSTWTEHVFYYGAQGRLGTYEPQWQGSTLRLVRREQNYYFAGRLLKTNAGWLTMDRLGSVVYKSDEGVVRKHRPYGQEYGSSTGNDQLKFATYYRDNDSALDYADQRFYLPAVGRFGTPDPFQSGNCPLGKADNRYSYVLNDPINHNDPPGLFALTVGGATSELQSHLTTWFYTPPVGTSGDPAFPFTYQELAWVGVPWSYECLGWQCDDVIVRVPVQDAAVIFGATSLLPGAVLVVIAGTEIAVGDVVTIALAGKILVEIAKWFNPRPRLWWSEACQELLVQCRAKCSDEVPTSTDDGAPYFQCIRKCLEAGGC